MAISNSSNATVLRLGAALLLLLLFTASCGSSGNDKGLSLATPQSRPQPQAAEVTADLPELEALLMAEFERLGIDPHKVPAAAPKGEENRVFDLSFEVLAPEGAELSVIELVWTERLVGDYDQNGLVNIGDLTPLGAGFSRSIAYRDPAVSNGVAYWPLGEPDDDGAADAPQPPAEDSAARNWRLARVDGDGNGELNISDLTPIAAHWNESIDGYRIYRRAPGESSFSLVANPDDPQAELTVARSTVEVDPSRPVRYRFQDSVLEPGTYEYQISAINLTSGGGGDEEEGEPSVSRALSLQPPSAVLSADPLFGSAPLMIDFDGSASSDPDGSIVTYQWDFDGDGVYDLAGAEALANHLYETSGTFLAALKVTDDDGLSDVAELEVNIYDCQPLLSLPDPPALGSGTVEDPYIVVNNGEYQLQLLDCGGADISTDPDTTYIVSDGAGIVSNVSAVLTVDGEFTGDFVVSATHDGIPTASESNIHMRVLAPFFIMPDPEDLDWIGVLGSGTEASPYVMSSPLFNSDFSREFSMIANTEADGSGTDIDVMTLTWGCLPTPFTVSYSVPGTFTVNTFSSGYIFAEDSQGVLSLPVYLYSQSLPD